MKIYNTRSFVKSKSNDYVYKYKKYVIPIFLKHKDKKKYLLDLFSGKQPVIKWKNKYYKIIDAEHSQCDNCSFNNECFNYSDYSEDLIILCSISKIFRKINCANLIFKEIEEYEALFSGD